MSRNMSRHQSGRRQNNQAIILTDYEDLHEHISTQHGSPLLVISELLDSARRHLKTAHNLDAVHIAAYADFSTLDEDGIRVQHRLHEYGYDSRFVIDSNEDSSTEMQICIDATHALHTSDAGTIVLVTATRRYLPLVHHLRRNGRRVIVLSLTLHPDDSFFDDGILYLDALDLFGPTMRARLASVGRDGQAYSGEEGDGRYGAPVERPSISRISSTGLLQALRIIEEYFGQYEEVYLTPLLRKLSELMDDERHDPKDVISGLEEAGAVWLEKRPAHPHDYTVLIVDEEHPDVIAIRDEYRDAADVDSDYDDDPYYYDGDYDDDRDEYEEDRVGASDENYDEHYDDEEEYDDPRTSAPSSDEMTDDSLNDDFDKQRFAD